jgi:hypothetical protein
MLKVAANLVDNGSPTTLKWSFPDGEPTPDPAGLLGLVSQSQNSQF